MPSNKVTNRPKAVIAIDERGILPVTSATITSISVQTTKMMIVGRKNMIAISKVTIISPRHLIQQCLVTRKVAEKASSAFISLSMARGIAKFVIVITVADIKDEIRNPNPISISGRTGRVGRVFVVIASTTTSTNPPRIPAIIVMPKGIRRASKINVLNKWTRRSGTKARRNPSNKSPILLSLPRSRLRYI